MRSSLIPPSRQLRPMPHYRRAHERLGTTGDALIDERAQAHQLKRGRARYEFTYGPQGTSSRRGLAAAIAGARLLASLGIDVDEDLDRHHDVMLALERLARELDELQQEPASSEPETDSGAIRLVDATAPPDTSPLRHPARLVSAPRAPAAR